MRHSTDRAALRGIRLSNLLCKSNCSRCNLALICSKLRSSSSPRITQCAALKKRTSEADRHRGWIYCAAPYQCIRLTVKLRKTRGSQQIGRARDRTYCNFPYFGRTNLGPVVKHAAKHSLAPGSVQIAVQLPAPGEDPLRGSTAAKSRGETRRYSYI
jgi:hypothetical protein